MGLIVSAAAASRGEAAERVFRLQFPASVRAEPFTGRAYVFFGKGDQPRRGPNWFKPEPMVAVDVEKWSPGEVLTVKVNDQQPDPKVLTYPQKLDPTSLAGLKAQGVVRFNPVEREVGQGSGNGFSDPVVVDNDGGGVSLTIDQLVPPENIPDTEWAKVFRASSKLLSDFHGREVSVAGAVRLPPSYATQPMRRYPVIFEIPGFGGGLKAGMTNKPYAPETVGGVEFLHVVLDPNCALGHHVFADSANNGPVGRALVEEFLPAFDKAFRTTGTPAGRFVTGHSSGGWSSLWLQVTYPDVFNGVWSTAPDPVDFRDFQLLDIYRAGENMYVDRQGQRIPIARRNGKPALWNDDFIRMEEVLGPGGQMHSFEAVFSPRGANGRPRLLWDRETGAIDRAVAETWKAYDIRLILDENWKTLGPKLAGKLHVFMGDQDTFYLDGATKLLKESLEKLKSDAVVEIHPGADHSTLMTPALRARIPREMSERYLKSESVKQKAAG